MTSIGDIEIELVFHIGIRGRMRDLAALTRILDESRALILLPIKEQAKAQENGDKRILVSIGRSD